MLLGCPFFRRFAAGFLFFGQAASEVGEEKEQYCHKGVLRLFPHLHWLRFGGNQKKK
jgi:hypothetical protein